MKNNIKTFAICSLITLSANAVAQNAQGTFQWIGTVPESDKNDGTYEIINNGSIDFDKGSLVFNIDDSDVISIQDSSELSFNVVDSSSGDQAEFSYTLRSIRYSSGGGFLTEDIGNEFIVSADGTNIVKGDKQPNINGPVNIKLNSKSGGFTYGVVSENDQVVVQATIIIEDATI